MSRPGKTDFLLDPGVRFLNHGSFGACPRPTDHECDAMDRTSRYVCGQIGTRYVQLPIPLPVTTHADFVKRFWAGITPRTRIIFISHITSATALTFPVAEICRRARAAGIVSRSGRTPKAAPRSRSTAGRGSESHASRSRPTTTGATPTP